MLGLNTGDRLRRISGIIFCPLKYILDNISVIFSPLVDLGQIIAESFKSFPEHIADEKYLYHTALTSSDKIQAMIYGFEEIIEKNRWFD